MRYIPHTPQTIGELWDLLGAMKLYSPSFKDRMGLFPEKNIETEFFALNEGLLTLRKKLGEERYATLRGISDRMRVLFDSDPDDTNGGAKAGLRLILEMEDMLRSTRKPRVSE